MAIMRLGLKSSSAYCASVVGWRGERGRAWLTCLGCGLGLQVRLLYDGRERGRMYAAYALSSVMTPDIDLEGIRTAGVVPALISVLNTSRVRPEHCHLLLGTAVEAPGGCQMSKVWPGTLLCAREQAISPKSESVTLWEFREAGSCLQEACS